MRPRDIVGLRCARSPARYNGCSTILIRSGNLQTVAAAARSRGSSASDGQSKLQNRSMGSSHFTVRARNTCWLADSEHAPVIRTSHVCHHITVPA